MQLCYRIHHENFWFSAERKAYDDDDDDDDDDENTNGTKEETTENVLGNVGNLYERLILNLKSGTKF